MTTVAEIAKAAFDAVSNDITDAILAATMTDGTITYDGRVIFNDAKPPSGFPLSTASDRVAEVTLEGFGVVPAAGWTMTVSGILHYVLTVRDIVKSGTFAVARVISEIDMLWQTVEIVRNTNTDDGAGGYTTAPVTIATVTGGMVAMSGNERWANDRTEAQSTWQVIIPYYDGLLEGDYLTIFGRDYAINFIDDYEKRGNWHVLSVMEGVAT